MTKNKYFLSLLFFFLFSVSYAQTLTKDNRTLQTKIADLLAQMPADNLGLLDGFMQELAGLGEEGIVSTAGMLMAPGQGNDAAVRFTLGSYTSYVIRQGRENDRLAASKAYCRSLEMANDRDIKTFLIKQLQFAGKDEAVHCLEKYLTDENLCDPASRALVTIGTNAAQDALVNSLPKTKGACLNSVVLALGECRNKKAMAEITSLVSSGNPDLKKAALYSLSNMGDAASLKLMYSEAKKCGFTYEPTRAADAYIRWIERLTENNNSKLAEKQCQLIIKECTADNQVHTRIKGLAILTRLNNTAALPRLLTAVSNNNQEYRNAALELIKDLPGEKITSAIIKKASKLTDTSKADVIYMLGERGDVSVLDFVMKSIADPSKEVRMAAADAARKLGDDKALTAILDLMKKDDPDETAVAARAILSMKSSNIVSLISERLPDMPSSAKIALLEILAAKQANEKADIIKKQVQEGDAAVRLSALKAMQMIATEKDLSELFTWLGKVQAPDEVKAVQASVVTALGSKKERDEKASAVIDKMRKAPADQKNRYFRILSAIGGGEALKALAGEFQNGNDVIKKDAFAALTGWNDAAASSELWKICTGGNREFEAPALRAYVRSVSLSGWADDQKLLSLRKAIDLARSGEQKKLILSEVGKLRSLTAMVFAGRYIDDPDLQQDAATAVMNITLAEKSLYGDMVKNLVNKVIEVLGGPESQYQKEALRKHLESLPKDAGFVPMFNEKDLTGWKGLVANPIARNQMNAKKLAAEQLKADEIMKKGWSIDKEVLVFNGQGNNLCTEKKYGDFEMVVDWRIESRGDGGIYLRGSPQVQIWDATPGGEGEGIGSGGLYNNKINDSKPLKVSDNPTGEWNTFRIKMVGERVTVHLNGVLVVDNTIMENYWDRNIPIFPLESIELQAHGTWLGFRDIYIRELPRKEPWDVSPQEKKESFKALFDGMSMNHWTGNKKDYVVEDGNIVIYPGGRGGGNLYTAEEFSDFIFRFEFMLTPGANNGLGIRAPLQGDAAYVGMELQILDNDAEIYRNLQQYQYHGSVYGVIPAKRGYLKPTGEWNYQEVIAKGNRIIVNLNGTTILDGDIAEASKNGTMDKKEHPGLLNPRGHIGFLGHGSILKFRNIRIKDLSK